MRLAAALAVWVMAAGVLAGCFSDGPDPAPVPTFTPQLARADAAAIEIPPCALRPGTLSWPEVAPAPAPATPTMATIRYDAYGVPHVYADDEYSLWYANGWAQARERLFELDVLRLVGYGESARFLGASQLSSDFAVHRELYSRAQIDAQWQAAPDAAKDVLRAYSDGVNRYMLDSIARNELPGEFAAIGRVPPPWQPQDSVAVINYLIGYFGVAGGAELSNLRTLAQLGSTLGPDAAWNALGDLAWLRVDDSYTTIHPHDQVVNGCEDPTTRAVAQAATQLDSLSAAVDAVTFGVPDAGTLGIAGLDQLSPAGPPGAIVDGLLAELGGPYDHRPGDGLFADFKWGSNAFLLDPSRSSTGKAIMWGAPQMGYYKPPIPFQVGLHAPGYDAAGIGVAGAPGLVIGRNAHIAWTATSGIEDQVDLVELRLDGPRSYQWDGATKDMACHTVSHQTFIAPADLAGLIAGDVPSLPMVFEQEVCKAEGWPVVAINEAAGVAWMRTWTTRDEELPGALMWLNLARAASIDEFRAGVAEFPFTFNFLVAQDGDRAAGGGVAYFHTGNIPIRAPGIDPRLPTPAGSAYAWRGEVYTGGMGVWATEPSTGYFANWNNAPVFGWRAGDEAMLWGPVQRVQQIDYWAQRMLAEKGTLGWSDIARLNWLAATHDSLGLPFMPHLIAAAGTDPELSAVRSALLAWNGLGLPWRDADGDGRYDDPAHAIWDAWMQAMLDRVERDELGDLAHVMDLDPKTAGDAHAGDHGTLNNKLALVLKALEGNTAHDWCDDRATPATESCADAVTAALRAAQVDLTGRFGPDVADWLVPVHTSRFTVLGAANADERPMINRGSWVQVVALGEGLDGAGSAMPPSNTGRVNSVELVQFIAGLGEPPRLTRELDMYWTGEYKPFPLGLAEVEQVTTGTETLVILPSLV